MCVCVCACVSRISPSDGDSVVSDGSSGRDSGEDPRRGQVTPSDSKQARRTPINVANGKVTMATAVVVSAPHTTHATREGP